MKTSNFSKWFRSNDIRRVDKRIVFLLRVHWWNQTIPTVNLFALKGREIRKGCDRYVDSTMMRKMSQWFWPLRRFHKRRERIEITIETSETWDYQWLRENRSEDCPKYGCESVFVPPDVGAEVIRVDTTLLNGWAETGRVHFSEYPTDDRPFCLKSLGSQRESN